MIKQIARVEGPYGPSDKNEIIVFERNDNIDKFCELQDKIVNKKG